MVMQRCGMKMKPCCTGTTFLRKLIPQNFKGEVKSILKFSWPFILSNLTDFLIPIISLLFIGQEGEAHLAAIGLAISYCNIVGIMTLVGLDTATQTLSSQSFGAKNYKRYGIVMQRAFILQTIVIFTLLPLWINAERILLGLGQKKYIANLASQCIIWRIPGYVIQGLYFTMKSYLICQQKAIPLIFIGLLGVAFTVVANLLFVYYFRMGVRGSALAIDIASLVLCLSTFGYIYIKKIFQTWPGWSMECLLQWGQFAKLAVPGALMISFDWGSAEIGVILMGFIGEVALGTQSVVFNIIAGLFMLPLGISLATGVRVGNYLGSGEPKKAVNVAKAAVMLFWLLGSLNAVLLTCLKDYIGYVFTNSKAVLQMISKITPLIAVFHILDGSQGIMSGILRGIGLQKYGAIINFIGFDIVGLPLGAILGLVVHLKVLGFWIGMSVGMALQVALMMIKLALSNWKKLSQQARNRALGSNFMDENSTTEDQDGIDCMEGREELIDNELVKDHENLLSNEFEMHTGSDMMQLCENTEIQIVPGKIPKSIFIRTAIILLIPVCSFIFGIIVKLFL